MSAAAAGGKPQDLASASIADTLAALTVDRAVGLTSAEVDARRRAHGDNAVPESKEHPVLALLEKLWGVSAWMLEIIMVLSVVL